MQTPGNDIRGRKIPGYTVIDEAGKQGMKITTKRWLPDGISIPETKIKVITDKLHKSKTGYHLISLSLDDFQIHQSETLSDSEGRIQFEVSGAGSDIGIYFEGDPGFISVPDYKLDTSFPKAWEEITLTPFLFKKYS